jgi:ATPase subunit of ABC transporter with duplicated ATPase domains
MAGVRPGMRILDVGCGAGDVTLQPAAIAGSVFRDAGLQLPKLASRTPVSADREVLEYVADTVASLLPLMKQATLVSQDEDVLENLAERLHAVVQKTDAAAILPELAAAWACTLRRPARALRGRPPAPAGET